MRMFGTTVPQKQVDFLSVDAEGYEYEILSSNDWVSYRPTALVVELNQDKDGTIIEHIRSINYILVYYNGTNGIFVDRLNPDMQFDDIV